MISNKHIEQIGVLLSFWVLFSLTLPSKFNVIGIYALCVFSLFFIIKNKKAVYKNEFIFLCALFFLSHLAHLFFVDNSRAFSFEIEKKLSFIILPFFWLNLPISNRDLYKNKVLTLYTHGMSLFGLFLFLFASYTYYHTKDIEVFFYHDFVSFFSGNAIYYSLLFIISLVILFEKLINKIDAFSVTLVVFHSLILVLLSSKLFVFILVILFFYYLFKIKKLRLVLMVFGLVLLASQFLFKSQNIAKRYAEIEFDSIFSLKKEVSQSTVFDGFSLRKEFWNMGLNISQESTKNFMLGVGPGVAQKKMNQKIIERDMYIGHEGTENTGFLNYNFHNQYIQTFVEIGLIGVFILLLIFYYLIWLGVTTKNRHLIIVNLIFLLGYTTETFLSRQIGVVSFVGFNSIMVFNKNKQSAKASFKRAFDIAFSILVIILVLSWLLPLLSVFIFFDTKSFPLFVQERVGQFNKPFKCFKLRTMVKNEEAHHLPAQENDKRITRFGGFLRKYAIDELPQFFNVLIGDMSVVGPRPLMINEEKSFNEIILNFSARLMSKPGVTGLAQSHGYKGIVNDNADIRIRYRLDMLYIKRKSIWVDIKIVFQTIFYLINNKS